MYLGNGWVNCVGFRYAIGVLLVAVHAVVMGRVMGYICTSARAYRASASQEQLGRLCSNLVCGLGVVN